MELPREMIGDARLSATALRVAHAMWSVSTPARAVCLKPVSWLARKTKCDARTVRRALASLERYGYILRDGDRKRLLVVPRWGYQWADEDGDEVADEHVSDPAVEPTGGESAQPVEPCPEPAVPAPAPATAEPPTGDVGALQLAPVEPTAAKGRKRHPPRADAPAADDAGGRCNLSVDGSGGYRTMRGGRCAPGYQRLTSAEQAALERVLVQLHASRKAAGMPVASKPNAITATGAGPFYQRLHELEAGEDDPVGLLCAVVAARVHEQSKRTDSPKHRDGHFAKADTICRDNLWEGNLAAGRALLARAKGDTSPETLIAVAAGKVPTSTSDDEPIDNFEIPDAIPADAFTTPSWCRRRNPAGEEAMP